MQRVQKTDTWTGGLALSLLLHAALLAGVLYSAAVLHILPLGGQHPGTAGAGAIEADLVSEVPGGAIPMPSPTEVETRNRLASDNPGAAVSSTRPPRADRNSVALPDTRKPLPDLAQQEAMRQLDQLARSDASRKNDDRVAYGNGGAVSFSYSMAGEGVGGGGGMAFGDASFGTMYTDWVNHLRDRLSFYWDGQYRDPSVPTNRLVTVQFVVLQSGQLESIDFYRRTNIPDLDSMALHAVQQAAGERFPLPAGYNHPRLEVQVTFELK